MSRSASCTFTLVPQMIVRSPSGASLPATPALPSKSPSCSDCACEPSSGESSDRPTALEGRCEPNGVLRSGDVVGPRGALPAGVLGTDDIARDDGE